MSDEKPGIAGRVGQVLYWAGCILSALLVVVMVLNVFVGPPSQSGLLIPALLVALLIWLAGRGARYILKGD